MALELRLALATIVLAAPGCMPVCDEAGLSGVAEALQSHALEDQQRGLEALARVCPSLPTALHRSLTVDFSEAPLELKTQVMVSDRIDSAWNELLERTCPRGREPIHELFDVQVDAIERDRFVRARCELDRYGLLAPGDRFVSRDLLPMMLYEWLVSGRVEPDAAAGVVRPLLSAQATPAELETMCRQRELACADVFEHWRLHPPASTIDVPPQTGVELRIAPRQLWIDRSPMIPLIDGRPDPAVFSFHLSPPLVATLHGRAELEHMRLRVSPDDWNAKAIVLADRDTPFATLGDVMFNATKAGFTSFELVVHQGYRLRALTVRPEVTWLQHRVHPHALEREVVVRIHRDSAEASISHGASEPTVVALSKCNDTRCPGFAELRSLVSEIQRVMPHMQIAHIQVDGDAPLHNLVMVADVLRGDGCSLEAAMSGAGFEDCAMFDLRIDTWPPIHYAIGRTGSLTLSEATVRTQDAPGGPSKRALLAAYASARDGITRCLVEHPELLRRLDDEDVLTVSFARSSDEPKRSTARVDVQVDHDDWSQLHRCVLEPLKIDAKPEPMRPRDEDVQVELVIPVRFSPP
ncbi:hypothetical protein [Paraliomyxa miuraensis]|uniref:hypothetical protein n=1 Tax=Paraliomyxa miuraensis TaxID=376150 RepID=UPI0022501FE8|nr:hypothetical protein [Paraliomyxa miuraensis]MCX4246360.1 hypothetical protein [Paraliomyxa miuraensis]